MGRCLTIYLRIIHNLIRPIAPSEKREIVVNDVTVEVETTAVDAIPWYEPPYPIESTSEYERIESEAIESYCAPGDRVAIIGGGLGVTTIKAAQVVGTRGSVIAYEQSRPTFEIATRTLELNRTDADVEIINAAIGEPAFSNLSYGLRGSIEVIAPQDLPDVDVFEMDCEGAEIKILSELPDSKLPPTILVETHNNHEEVADLLEKRGYEIVEVVDDAPSQHPICTHIRAKKLE